MAADVLRDVDRSRSSEVAKGLRVNRAALAANRKQPRRKPRVPAATEIAIHDQQGALGTAISLLWCLHAALRREIEEGGSQESEAIMDAAEWADLTEITGMLLVRLHAVHTDLDSVALGRADLDPKQLSLAEAARKLLGGDKLPGGAS